MHPPLRLTLTAPDEPGFLLERVQVYNMQEVWAVLEIVREQCWLNELLNGIAWMPEVVAGPPVGDSREGEATEEELRALLSGQRPPFFLCPCLTQHQAPILPFRCRSMFTSLHLQLWCSLSPSARLCQEWSVSPCCSTDRQEQQLRCRARWAPMFRCQRWKKRSDGGAHLDCQGGYGRRLRPRRRSDSGLPRRKKRSCLD
jgi:hypothetical protein